MHVDQTMPGVFLGRRIVYWSDCDPAKIVYAPRFGKWLHDLLERWFEQVVKVPYVHFIEVQGIGFPTRSTATTFHRPAHHGEIVEVRLKIERIGKTSITFGYQAWRLDVEANQVTDLLFDATETRVVVCLSDMTPLQISDNLRDALERFKAAAPAEKARDAS